MKNMKLLTTPQKEDEDYQLDTKADELYNRLEQGDQADSIHTHTAQQKAIAHRALLISLRKEDFKTAHALVSGGADVNYQNTRGESPLFQAVSQNSIASCHFLIQNRVNLGLLDKDENNALMYAAMFDSLDIMKYLIVRGLQVDHANRYGNTALFHSALINSVGGCQILIEHGANLGHQNIVGETAIDYGISQGHSDIWNLFNDSYTMSEMYRHNFVFQDQTQLELNEILQFYKQKSESHRLFEILNQTRNKQLRKINEKKALGYAILHDYSERLKDELPYSCQDLLDNYIKTFSQSNISLLTEKNLDSLKVGKSKGNSIRSVYDNGSQVGRFMSLLSIRSRADGKNTQDPLQSQDKTSEMSESKSQRTFKSIFSFKNDLNTDPQSFIASGPQSFINTGPQSFVNTGPQSFVNTGNSKDSGNSQKDKSGNKLYNMLLTGGQTRNVSSSPQTYEVQMLDVNDFDKFGYTQLFKACCSRNPQQVRRLLNDPNIDVNKGSKNGDTPLFIATFCRHNGIIELLLRHKDIDVNRLNSNKLTILQYITKYAYERGDQIRLVLDRYDVDIYKSDKYLQSPAYFGLFRSDREIRKMFIDCARFDFSKLCCPKGTFLCEAAYQGRIDIVEDIVTNLNFDGKGLNQQNVDGDTALGLATQEGHLDICKLLLEQPNIDANIPSNDSKTPLTRAVFNTHSDTGVSNQMLDLFTNSSKVQVNSSDISNNNQSILVTAVVNNNNELCRNLIQNSRININQQNSEGQTALHCATLQQNIEVVQQLIQHPDIDTKQRFHNLNALQASIIQGKNKACEVLIRSPKVDINELDNTGQSPLHLAVCQNNEVIVKQLVRHPQIAINQKNWDGYTPLTLATVLGQGYAKCCQQLFNHPCIDISIKDHEDLTALDWAKKRNDRDILEVYKEAVKVVTLKDGRRIRKGSIVNSQVIGQGKYGVVYDVELDQQYMYKSKEFFQLGMKVQKKTTQIAVKKLDLKITNINCQSYKDFDFLDILGDHPNIQKIYGIGYDAYSYYIFQERSQMNLSILIKNCQKQFVKSNLPTPLAIEVAKELVDGLKYIHSKNITHRDLKPQNILINNYADIASPDLGFNNLKDEGFIRITDIGQDVILKKGTSQIQLKPAPGRGRHFSREVKKTIDDNLQVQIDMHVDIYQLGCLLMYIFLGGLFSFKYIEENIGNQNQPKEQYEIMEKLDDLPEAQYLIQQMTSGSISQRPKIALVAQSPLFWSQTQKLEYLCDISDVFSSFDESDKIVMQFNKLGSRVFGNLGWNTYFGMDYQNWAIKDQNLQEDDFNKLTALLVSIRRYCEQSQDPEFDQNIKNEIEIQKYGQMGNVTRQDMIMRSYSSRFPPLVFEVYCYHQRIINNMEDEYAIKPYKLLIDKENQP